MDPLVHLAHVISPLAAGLLIASVWQGILLTGAVALISRALPAVSPAARIRIWTAVLLLVLLLPLANLLIPHTAVPAHAQLHVAQDWSLALLTLWVVVAAVRAAVLAANAVRVARLAARAVQVTVPDPILPLLGGPRPALLCASTEVNRPSVAGFFRPRVLLPKGLLETLSPAELEHVILHEMEHLRRRDDWMNLLQQVSLIVLPLHPALLWLDRRLCRERELACDDGVLAATKARRTYAACLVKLAEDSLVRKGIALALSALGTRAREADLVNRVRRILAGPQASPAAVNPRSVTAILSASALALTALLARTPQLVSFDPAAPASVAQAVEPVAPTLLWPSLAILVQASAPIGRAVARPVLTSAVLVQPRIAHPLRATSLQRRRSRIRLVSLTAVSHNAKPQAVAPVRDPAFAPGSWSTLAANAVLGNTPQPATISEQPGAPAARVVVTEFEVSRPIFAAVPVRGGWLILQL